MPDGPAIQQLQQALADHQKGALEQAEAGYRAVLAVSPEHPDALHLLGLLMDERNRIDEALLFIRRAIAASPQGVFYLNLGNVLRRAGDGNGAIRAWQQSAELSPDLAADAYANIAALLSTDRSAGDQATHAKLAAHAAARTQANPNDPAAWADLATAQHGVGQTRAAVASATQACRLAPDNGHFANQLGCLLMQDGKPAKAVPVFRAAAARFNDSRVLVNLAGALGLTQRDLSEAVAIARHAIELDPKFAGAHETVATLTRQAGRAAESVLAARQALALAPRSATALDALGNTLFDLGRTDEAVAAFRGALAVDPNRAATGSNVLMVMHYQSRFDPAEALEEHRRWAARHADPITERVLRDSPPHAIDRDPQRRLRIGYVSPDFRRHPVALFFAPLLDQHTARDEIDVVLYSNTSLPDDVTQRFAKQATTFREIFQMSDEDVAQQVRDDRIDILVDLAGHTAHNRLLVFARKPAPVQASYIGYWNTTGMRAIDYRLTDQWNDPPDVTERWWVERLVRLDGGAWCFIPPTGRPDVAESPAARDGYVTFISTNKLAKVSDGVLQRWRQIIEGTRSAKLLIVAGEDEGRVRRVFKGVDSSRFELLPRTSFEQYLEQYGRADVLLDVEPHNGHTTSIDALWQGVPVLTLAGDVHCSRLGASLLSAIGLERFICESPARYVERAIALEDQIDALAELRRTMRDRLRASPLTDAARLARVVEEAYRTMWQEFCCSATK